MQNVVIESFCFCPPVPQNTQKGKKTLRISQKTSGEND
jgi:hypothetical protein